METRYFLDELQPYSQVVEEYDTAGNAKNYYVYGLDLIGWFSGIESEFYYEDGLGYIRLLTNELGVVGATYTYDAYGNLIAGNGSSN